MLSHWSGLTHEAPVGNNFSDRDCTFEEHVESISESWLKYPVGQRCRYSNLGIDLAGYALQLISNKPFIQYMKEELFEPLGMDNSTYDQKHVMENCVFAKGHIGEYEAPTQMIHMIPAGGLFSSASDMARFVSFHLKGGIANGKHIIDDQVLNEMYKPQFSVKGQTGGYGLGILVVAPGGINLGNSVLPTFNAINFDHSGGGYGYLTEQRWLPEYNIGVVVLTNQMQNNSVQEIAQTALEKMIETKLGSVPKDEPIKFTDKPIINLETDKLQRLEGNYRVGGDYVSVRAKDGKLWMEIGESERELKPHGETEFTDPGGMLITFELDQTGKPTGMQLLDNSRNYYVPLDSAPSDNQGPDKKEWNELTGIYSGITYANLFHVCATVRNGYLCIIETLFGLEGARLREYKSKIFFTCDGEAVIFRDNNMTYGNIPLAKEAEPYNKLLELARNEPDNGRLKESSIQSLANAYLAMEDTDKALDVFALNARVHPKSTSALHCLAETYLNKGDKVNSEKYYRRILEIDPKNVKALKMLDKTKKES